MYTQIDNISPAFIYLYLYSMYRLSSHCYVSFPPLLPTPNLQIVSRAACHGFGETPEKWLRRYNDELTCVDKLPNIECPVWVAIHTDKKWNHQVLDHPFDKIKDLSVHKFSVAEDGTLGAYWEGGAASTMASLMDFVEDKVPAKKVEVYI